jgi:hypothetical protein
MPILKIAFVSLSLFSAFSTTALAAGAKAVCTDQTGLTVEVDLLKGTMRISKNELATSLLNITKQGLAPDKRVVLVAGEADDRVVLALNDTIGSASTLVLGERRVEVVCR